MTVPSDAAAQEAFRARVLDARTTKLARRGLDADPDAGLLPPRLVCETNGWLCDLEPAAVEAVQRFRCHRLPLVSPLASGTMLGVFSHGGRIYSLLELARLLGHASDAGRPAGGVMLLLRGEAPSIALRVDRVLGLRALRDAGDNRHGSLASGLPASPAGIDADDQRLALLIDLPGLRDAILLLDTSPSSDPAAGA